MKRLLLIVNPSASGFTGARLRQMQERLRTDFELATVWPESPAESRQAASTGAKEGFDVVAAMGGDGTVHHVANGLIGTEAALGVIPSGTTNVIGRLLGIRRRNAAHVIKSGVPTSVAAAAATLDGSPRPEFALFSVGTGYDAEVLDTADRQPASKLSLGSLHYAGSALRVLWSRFRDRTPSLRVTAHGRHAEAVAVSIQVQSSYTYFGPIPLALGPKRDGLTVLAARSLSLTAAGALLTRIVARRTAGTPHGELWAGVSAVRIEADPESLVQIDGELMGRATTLDVAPAPKPLRVMLAPDVA